MIFNIYSLLLNLQDVLDIFAIDNRSDFFSLFKDNQAIFSDLHRIRYDRQRYSLLNYLVSVHNQFLLFVFRLIGKP